MLNTRKTQDEGSSKKNEARRRVRFEWAKAQLEDLKGSSFSSLKFETCSAAGRFDGDDVPFKKLQCISALKFEEGFILETIKRVKKEGNTNLS